MSDLRPAWLTDDETWREQLRAMPHDDLKWFERQWKIAGGPPPDIDRSWIKTERVGSFTSFGWCFLFPLGLLLVLSIVVGYAVEMFHG